jgi:hypothetical protein
MSTKSRESIYGASIRASAERAKEADNLACQAWNARNSGTKGPAGVKANFGEPSEVALSCHIVRIGI